MISCYIVEVFPTSLIEDRLLAFQCLSFLIIPALPDALVSTRQSERQIGKASPSVSEVLNTHAPRRARAIYNQEHDASSRKSRVSGERRGEARPINPIFSGISGRCLPTHGRDRL